MNNKDQENEVWKGPLIFTVPACGFVMALYVDWLGQSNRGDELDKLAKRQKEPASAKCNKRRSEVGQFDWLVDFPL